MLVLSRRRDESLVIDGHIRITVLNGNGHTTRLGIDAPRSVTIMRSELLADAPMSSDSPLATYLPRSGAPSHQPSSAGQAP